MNGLDKKLDEWIATFHREVVCEVQTAISMHEPMSNPHEAYAVILEELDEFWDEVRKRVHSEVAMRRELTHIAAMACRASIDLGFEGE